MNPNSKITGAHGLYGEHSRRDALFRSGAILLYLADKFDAFLPDRGKRAEALNWLFADGFQRLMCNGGGFVGISMPMLR